MNIFVTSTDPIESSKYLDDKRVIKMILETAQLLSTALVHHGLTYRIHYATGIRFNKKLGKFVKAKDKYHYFTKSMKCPIYAPTHSNHPCSVWARESKENYGWLLQHFVGLNDEYTRRYGKVHKSYSLFPQLSYDLSKLPSKGLTPFANCAAHSKLGVSYKHISDVPTAYQLYLNDRWDMDARTPTWYGVEK